MNDLIGGANYPTQSMASEKMAHMPTMRQRLKYAVENAKKQLEDAQRAYEIFDKNPDLEELINILQRARI